MDSDVPPPPYDEKLRPAMTTSSISKSTSSSSLVPSSSPIKTYTIINPHTFRQSRQEIHYNDQPILWTHTSGGFKLPVSRLYSSPSEQTGAPVLAACKPRHWSNGYEVCLGNPDDITSSAAGYDTVTSESTMGRSYRFHAGTGVYEWRRTHNKELGASRWGNQDFKLMEVSGADGNGGGEKVMAVFVHTQCLFKKRHEVGRLEFFVDLGRDAELITLAVLVAVQYAVAQSNAQAAAGS